MLEHLTEEVLRAHPELDPTVRPEDGDQLVALLKEALAVRLPPEEYNKVHSLPLEEYLGWVGLELRRFVTGQKAALFFGALLGVDDFDELFRAWRNGEPTMLDSGGWSRDDSVERAEGDLFMDFVACVVVALVRTNDPPVQKAYDEYLDRQREIRDLRHQRLELDARLALLEDGPEA